jgi:uncharacterized alpha-E superfamily protein
MLCRVADSLFWMSRYIERAENNARILDVNLRLRREFDPAGVSEQPGAEWTPIISSLEDQERFHKLHAQATADSVMDFLTFERENPSSIFSCLARARENARSVREQISSSTCSLAPTKLVRCASRAPTNFSAASRRVRISSSASPMPR